MNPVLKKTIGSLAAIFILSVAYYGNYLPLHKSQIFINSLRNDLRSINSEADFEHKLSVPLDLPSPIGQEELVRNSSNLVLNLIQSNNDPVLIGRLIDYLDGYYNPIIARDRGMSFEQNLYVLGAINETAFVKTKDVKYLEAAQKYYSHGIALGPNRPQFLYGMFDIYRMEGNIDGVKTVAERILSQWPTDDRTRAALADFLAQAAAAQAQQSQQLQKAQKK